MTEPHTKNSTSTLTMCQLTAASSSLRLYVGSIYSLEKSMGSILALKNRGSRDNFAALTAFHELPIDDDVSMFVRNRAK